MRKWYLTVVAALVALAGARPLLASQSSTASFEISVTVAADAPSCGVTAAGSLFVRCIPAPSQASAPVGRPVLLLQEPAQDGWVAWTNYRAGSSPAWVVPAGEVSSRMVNIGGVEFIEMTFSW